MTDEKTPTTPQGLVLTNLQRSRIDFARRDLESARAEDLGQLPQASLILLVERMRGRLDDILKLIEEAAAPPSPSPQDR